MPIGLLPCVEPNDAPQARTLGADFAYDGRPMSPAEFTAHLATYNFGTIEPDQVVIHNTANPDATWAALNNNTATNWDRAEQGLSLTAIRNKRQKQLDAIKAYYVRLGWSTGPHLFIDDRWIWLFTPLELIGTHAKEGNSYRDSSGRLHYTIGIEVVGWYGKVVWPPAVQVMVRSAVQALQKRLKTFEIVYKPAPDHLPAAHQGSIAFHYDYNKQECPGARITPAWAIPILKEQPAPPSGVPYMAMHTQAVFESPAPDGKVALNGMAEIRAGTAIEIDEIKKGWAHLASGLGFVPSGILRKL